MQTYSKPSKQLIPKRWLLDKHFCKKKKKKSNIWDWNGKIAYLHFSYCKCMETLSCHSNQSSYSTGIKSTNYVETTVRNMYTKYRLVS